MQWPYPSLNQSGSATTTDFCNSVRFHLGIYPDSTTGMRWLYSSPNLGGGLSRTDVKNQESSGLLAIATLK